MRVEKRIPFGFHGDWGKVYKRYTTKDTLLLQGGQIITYENNTYIDIGQDVQFKRVNDTTDSTEQTSGVMTNAVYTTVETTDAYFDNSKQVYSCVVQSDDLVKVFGKLWMVTSITVVTKQNPKEQQFFYLELKGVS